MSEAASNRDRDPAFEKVNDDNRAFLIQCGPILPSIDFPQTDHGRKKYRFSKNWYNEYDWIDRILAIQRCCLSLFLPLFWHTW